MRILFVTLLVLIFYTFDVVSEPNDARDNQDLFNAISVVRDDIDGYVEEICTFRATSEDRRACRAHFWEIKGHYDSVVMADGIADEMEDEGENTIRFYMQGLHEVFVANAELEAIILPYDLAKIPLEINPSVMH